MVGKGKFVPVLKLTKRYAMKDSSVGIATGYGRDDRGVRFRVPVRSRIFSSPQCPDRLWSPTDLLSNGYQGANSPRVKQERREADHSPQFVQWSRTVELYLHFLICLHSTVLN
jgi:hypothetical protein